jgi:hypothetical protein
MCASSYFAQKNPRPSQPLLKICTVNPEIEAQGLLFFNPLNPKIILLFFPNKQV